MSVVSILPTCTKDCGVYYLCPRSTTTSMPCTMYLLYDSATEAHRISEELRVGIWNRPALMPRYQHGSTVGLSHRLHGGSPVGLSRYIIRKVEARFSPSPLCLMPSYHPLNTTYFPRTCQNKQQIHDYLSNTRIPAIMSTQERRAPFPPFTAETAEIKVKAAQDAWNTR